jgi:hypothetical protein
MAEMATAMLQDLSEPAPEPVPVPVQEMPEPLVESSLPSELPVGMPLPVDFAFDPDQPVAGPSRPPLVHSSLRQGGGRSSA